LQLIAPLAQAKPEMLKRLDGDKIMKTMPDWSGIPQDWIVSDDEYEAQIQAEQQRAALQEALQAAQAAGPAARDVAAAADSPGLAEIAQQLTGNAG
jgi:hypothetical protein